MSTTVGIFLFIAIAVIIVVVSFIIRQGRNDRLGEQQAPGNEAENADLQGQDTSSPVKKGRSFAPAWIIVIVTVICICQLMTVLYFKSQGEH
jgi:hypothetical protein